MIFDPQQQYAPYRVSLQKAAKKKIEQSTSDAKTKIDGHIYFVIYTLAICSGLVNDASRSTALNTLQLGHNIQNCLVTEWLDEDCRQLLELALVAMEND